VFCILQYSWIMSIINFIFFKKFLVFFDNISNIEKAVINLNKVIDFG